MVAVEPSPALRAEAVRRHPDIGVRWVADQLPALPATLRLGLAFDVILLPVKRPPSEEAGPHFR